MDPIKSNTNVLRGEWVGSMVLRGEREFIHLTFRADHQGVLDRPNKFLFQMPLADLHIARSAVRFRVDSLTFDGALQQDRFVGAVREETTAGTFEIFPTRTLTPSEYARVIGHYRLAPDCDMMLSRGDWSDLPFYFYVDSDQIIRLYSLGSQRFLSERCEMITANTDADGNTRSLKWDTHENNSLHAPRIEWCREETVSISVGDHILAGTLLLPLGEGPHPAVMLCHHAGIHRRNYYRIFAEPFVQRGMAALIYDKRGSGDSTGAPLFSEINELADDACAVFRFLTSHSAIRADAVGIWGISNGGWVAPLAASRVGIATFVIGASVAGVTPARQEQFRRANVARELGASPRAVALIERLWGLLFQFYIDGRWNEELQLVLEQVYADEGLQRLPTDTKVGPSLQPVPPLYPIEQIRDEMGASWTEGGFDVAPVYAGLRCPILCLWGEHETVVPREESMDRIEQALVSSHHGRFQLQVIPAATHLLYLTSPEPVGMSRETMHTHLHNVRIAPGVRERMADWALGRFSGENPS